MPSGDPPLVRTGMLRAEVGRRGEALAADFLSARGLVLLARNWRCAAGELDLVMREGEEIVFVEVKTRTGRGYGAPAEAVTTAKQRRLRRLAVLYLRSTATRAPVVRFDVVAVLRLPGRPVVVEHLRGVC